MSAKRQIKKLKTVLAFWHLTLKGVEELADLKPVQVSIRSREVNIDDEVFFILDRYGW